MDTALAEKEEKTGLMDRTSFSNIAAFILIVVGIAYATGILPVQTQTDEKLIYILIGAAVTWLFQRKVET